MNEGIVEVDKKLNSINFTSVYAPLNQAYNKGFQYLLLDSDNKPLAPPMFCKDYFQDIFYTEYTGKILNSIYGFTYSEKNNLLDKDLKIAIRFFNDYNKRDIKSCVSNIEAFINKLEKSKDYPLSTFEIIEEGVVVTYPIQWTASSCHISLFLLLLRIGWKYNNEDPMDFIYKYGNNDQDSSFIASAKDLITLILTVKDSEIIGEILPEWKNLITSSSIFTRWKDSYYGKQYGGKEGEVYYIHNSSGILGISNDIKSSVDLNDKVQKLLDTKEIVNF